jgi:hypothetical protein
VIDDDQRRGMAILHGPWPRPRSHASTKLDRTHRMRSRTEKELEAIARRVAENTALMQRLREIIGSEDEDLAREVRHEIRTSAQTVDPTVSFDEGTTVFIVLLKIIGHLKDPIGG